MAKDKEDKTEEAVFSYLMAQNRPFSINDLLQNAQLKEHGKAAVQKSLDQLVVAGKVKEKVYNKQKIYLIDQSLISSSNDPDITQMDTKIFELTKQITEDEEVIKKCTSELKVLNSSLTADEASEQLNTLLEENEKMDSKLKVLSQNKVKLSAADFKKARTLNEKSTSELRKRKRICVDILDQILENYPKGKKALMEEVGIEPD